MDMAVYCEGQVAELTHKIEEREEVMQHALRESIAQQEKLLSEMKITVGQSLLLAFCLSVCLSAFCLETVDDGTLVFRQEML